MSRFVARHSVEKGWYVLDQHNHEVVETAYGRHHALSICRMLNREQTKLEKTMRKEN